VRQAPSPLLAAEMVLVRLAYVAELPPPAELARLLAGAADRPLTPAAPAPVPPPTAGPLALAPAPEAAPEAVEDTIELATPRSFAEAVELFQRFGEPMLYGWLYQAARLVRFEPGRIELQLGADTPTGLPGRIAAALGRWTGRPWLVSIGQDEGDHAAPTLAEQAAAEKRARIDALSEDPRVKPLLESFPGARIVDVRSAPD
jgi:DNA polymerase-3 subunit gamma/tau